MPRQPVHQVQPQVGETRGPDESDSRSGLDGGVAALQKPQFGLVKGLDPQAQAINPQVPVARQFVRVNIVGVGFQAELGIRGKSEMPAQIFHKFGKLGSCKQGGGAASQKEGIEAGEPAPVEPGLGVQGGEIDGNQGFISDGIEIAIGAFGFAEGDVNVKAG